jgi:hypothetical protein
MSEEVVNIEIEDSENIKKSKKLCIGFDVGTGTIQAARSDLNNVNIMRNVFLELNPDEINISDLSDINYVESDGKIFIIGNDAFRLSNIFSKEVQRPMERGLISSKEISSIDVIAIMIKDLIGDIKDQDAYLTYSIPAEAIDEGKSITYHEKVFARIFSAIGVNFSSLNEGMAIIYSECEKEKYSGIGISFGAGMVNVALAYKKVEAFKFSTSRSGDWIDKNVADSLSMIKNRVTAIKEKSLDLEKGFQNESNKKIRRVLESLTYYYESMIEYSIKRLIKEFNEKIDVELDDPVPIIISGGTSLPNGFLELYKNILSRYELPFEISEVRRAINPLTAVAQGLLKKTIQDVGK